jgi:hypothetical protein
MRQTAESKPFVFAKKEPKSFCLESVTATRTPNGQEFLRLFSKRSAFFLSMSQPQGNLV